MPSASIICPKVIPKDRIGEIDSLINNEAGVLISYYAFCLPDEQNEIMERLMAEVQDRIECLSESLSLKVKAIEAYNKL